MLKGAQKEIRILGTLYWGVLHQDWIESVLSRHISLKILTFDLNCSDFEARKKTLRGVTYKPFGSPSLTLEKIYDDLTREQRNYLEVKEYRLCPMHWFCIIDNKHLILNNYCYGFLGGSSAHLYFYDADKDDNSRIMLEQYNKVFNYVWNEDEITKKIF